MTIKEDIMKRMDDLTPDVVAAALVVWDVNNEITMKMDGKLLDIKYMFIFLARQDEDFKETICSVYECLEEGGWL